MTPPVGDVKTARTSTWLRSVVCGAATATTVTNAKSIATLRVIGSHLVSSNRTARRQPLTFVSPQNWCPVHVATKVQSSPETSSSMLLRSEIHALTHNTPKCSVLRAEFRCAETLRQRKPTLPAGVSSLVPENESPVHMPPVPPPAPHY